MAGKIQVGLVYGGKSGEHQVSLQTALAVVGAFDFSKYTLHPFYISPDGEWRKGKVIKRPIENVAELMFSEDLSGLGSAALSSGNSEPEIDVVFPLLHGTYGEDGTVQGLFELMNMPYVGSGVLASAVGMDKVFMKKVFEQEKLPQCLYRYFTKRQWQKDEVFFIMEIEISLGYPCFIKPANLGSSVGISKATDRDELIAAINEAFRYDRKVIVEEAVVGQEIELGILGNDDPEVSVPGEIVASNDFYDYEAKYVSGTSEMVIPAELPKETMDTLQQLAIRAYRAIEASGLSRVDFFVRQSDQAVLINEINTMPGFTPHSMYPLLWKHSGKSYTELLDRLIDLALKRYNEKQEIEYAIKT